MHVICILLPSSHRLETAAAENRNNHVINAFHMIYCHGQGRLNNIKIVITLRSKQIATTKRVILQRSATELGKKLFLQK